MLSGGRAWCGLGAGWHEHEHRLYGLAFPPPAERLDALEDALELLPLLWGPGSPPYAGRTLAPEAATCYPRPLQERIPLLVGGQGERRTLRLAARHADAVNLFGEPERVRAKLEVLARHCAAEARDASQIKVTHLSSAAVVDRPPGRSAHHDEAGTVEEQVGRYRRLAEAGVHEAIIRPVDLADGAVAIERLLPVLAAFRP